MRLVRLFCAVPRQDKGQLLPKPRWQPLAQITPQYNLNALLDLFFPITFNRYN